MGYKKIAVYESGTRKVEIESPERCVRRFKTAESARDFFYKKAAEAGAAGEILSSRISVSENMKPPIILILSGVGICAFMFLLSFFIKNEEYLSFIDSALWVVLAFPIMLGALWAGVRALMPSTVYTAVCKEVEFVVASSENIPGWTELAQEVKENFPGFERDEFIAGAKRAAEKKFGILAVIDDRVIGGIIADSELREILWFALDTKYRGRGIGRELLTRGLESMGDGDIWVVTYRDGDPLGRESYPLYKKFGFEDFENVDGFGYPCVKMVRKEK